MSPWEKLSDADLLEWRICDLQLELKGSELEKAYFALSAELKSAGLLVPEAYLADEWFSPEGVFAMGLPFWLLHPRLRELERRMMGEVEGETGDECMRLLRHEAGHCFDHAYRWSRRLRWRLHFGSPRKAYDPDRFLPVADSPDFVVNLAGGYAQSHPDEDFAETFAVWLRPDRDWQKDYAPTRFSKARKKLHYINELVQELRSGQAKPLYLRRGPRLSEAHRLRSTLLRHYTRRLRERGQSLPPPELTLS